MSLERHPYHEWISLEQPRLGTKVCYATDEFFAAKERLIDPKPPVFIDDKYDDHGKWMDGWESRRKRIPGHDHCVIHLGVPGIIRGLDINTSYFTGNFPPQASVDACVSDEDNPEEGWTELVAKVDQTQAFVPILLRRFLFRADVGKELESEFHGSYLSEQNVRGRAFQGS